MCPSIDPANTTPGINVAGPGCAALHPATAAQAGATGVAAQIFFPVAMSSANTPPPDFGSVGDQSDSVMYVVFWSAAPPNSTPPRYPSIPPLQTAVPSA